MGGGTRDERGRRRGRITPGGDESSGEDRATPAACSEGGHGLSRSVSPGRRARRRQPKSRRGRTSQRHAGRVGREAEPRTRKGKPSKGKIPGALPSEIGRKGFGGNKASGGCETLEAQRNRVRQARGMSLPDSASAGGTQTLERRVSPRGFTQTDLGHTPEGNESSRGVRGIN
jgi:hypothetical protein